MNRILLTICLVLSLVAVFLYWELTATKEENALLNNKVRGYENAIQKYNDAQERAGEKIEKVRTIVRNVKSDCDCYNTLLPDGVRKILREDQRALY